MLGITTNWELTIFTAFDYRLTQDGSKHPGAPEKCRVAWAETGIFADPESECMSFMFECDFGMFFPFDVGTK